MNAKELVEKCANTAHHNAAHTVSIGNEEYGALMLIAGEKAAREDRANQKRGWYSAQQERLAGSVIYQCADDSGKAVIVTEVSSGIKPFGNWPDYQDRGLVGDYLQSYRQGQRDLATMIDTFKLSKRVESWLSLDTPAEPKKVTLAELRFRAEFHVNAMQHQGILGYAADKAILELLTKLDELLSRHASGPVSQEWLRERLGLESA